MFAMHHGQPNEHCPVGRNTQAVLEVATDAAQRALEAELAHGTVANILTQLWPALLELLRFGGFLDR